MSTEITINQDQIDINVDTTVVTIEAPQGGYPLPNNVYSVFGRIGNVVAQEGDYTLTQLGGVTITNPLSGQALVYNGTSWVNNTETYVGTVTSVNMSVPTGLTISGNPITTAGTLALGLASGYSIPTTASQATWNTAYNDSIVSAAVTGTTTKTLTLNQQDGGTVTANWSDLQPVTSVFGRTGDVVAQSGDYNTLQVTENTNLYFTDQRARFAISGDATSGVVYSNTTGIIALDDIPNTSLLNPSLTVNGKTVALGGSTTLTTSDIGEGTNLYFTTARAQDAISGTAPISVSGGVVSISQANSTTNGYLSSADWTTFNSKQNALTLGNLTSSDITVTGGTGAVVGSGSTLTLATVNSNLGTFGSSTAIPVITVNGKGLVTAVTTDAVFIPSGALSFIGDVTGTGNTGSDTTLTLATVNSNVGSYGTSTSVPTITVNAKGLVTAASQTAIPTATSSVTGLLTSSDWSTFNGKQAQLNGTGFVKVSGTTVSYDNSTYLTTIEGIAAGGELSGTYASPSLVNSAVTGKVLTGLNVTGGSVTATDSILAAFGKVQNQINGLIGGSIYQGTWNASTNTPALASGVGTKGYYYIVSVAGSTNLDGITDWNVGDWAIYDGTAWQQVDNTDAVVSVNGFTGAVSLTTSDISEGTNLYYTDARARGSVSAGTGISYNSTTGVITNSAPDQTVSLTASTGISTSGTYPNFTITNTAPDQTVSLTSGTGISATGTYPSFTITNTAPDQTVSLTGAGTTSISGTYPNFTITSNDQYVGTVTSVSASLPISSTGGATPNLSITQATTSTDGYLSSTDWNTFNNKVSSATLAGYVPYTGATTNVNLGTHTLSAANLVVNHTSGSGVAASITKGGNGEALTVVKSSGSGNAASITGGVTLLSELNLTTDLADAYIASATTWNAKQDAITLTTTGNNGASTFVSNTLNIPTYTLAGLGGINLTSLSATSPLLYDNTTGVFSIQQSSGSQAGFLSAADWTTFNNKVPSSRTLSINGTTYDLSADRSWTITPNVNATNTQDYTATAAQTTFTVTGGYTVGQLAVFYNGSKLASNEFTATNGTTFVLATACQANDIVQAVVAVTGGGIGGSGTTNYISKWTASGVLGNSGIIDNGTSISIDTNNIALTQKNAAGTGTVGLLRVTAANIVQIGDGGTINPTVISFPNGNVGIGTNSPSSLLQVSGSSTTYGTAFSILNTSNSKQWNFTAVGSGAGSRNGNLEINNNAVDILTINQAGNVGIGLTAPNATLHIVSGVNTRYNTFDGPSAGYCYQDYRYNGTIYGYLGQASSIVGGGSNTDMALVSNNSLVFGAGGTTEKARITNDGWFRASNTGNYITGTFHEFSSSLNNSTSFRIKATSSVFTDYILFVQADKANNSDYSFIQARSSNTSDTEFNLRGDGNAFADGSWQGGGADYAEYFEWFDGNPNNEDRRGYSVSLVGNKIKIAEKGETIIGVISGNPSIIGDSAWNMWAEKYLRDDFGTYIRDEEGFRILNPNYNPDIDYISREERPEWGIVGLMGKLCIRKGQEVMPNWIKMKDISDSVEQWLIK
jgi:hypothetical protein